MKRCVDGQWIDAPRIDELPREVTGVFETLLLREAAPLFWSEHWARFSAGCRWAGFGSPVTENVLRTLIGTAARENGISDGVGRFAAWRDASDTVRWSVDATPPRPHMRRAEFTAHWGAPIPIATDDRAFKHFRRTAWNAALRTARATGADEALLCDHQGRVIEGCVSNVFFVRDGQLHTPLLRLGPLPGIMRQEVIAFAQSQCWPVHEAEYFAHDLDAATEIWLTNSLIGIRPVARLAQQLLDPRRAVLERFRTAWRQARGYDPVFIAPNEA